MPTPEWEPLTPQAPAEDLKRFVKTYWIVPQETLSAYYDQGGASPALKTDQTVWYITRVEQRYLFGYCWGMIDGIPIVVQKFTASIQPDGQAEFFFYVQANSPATGRGTFDFEANKFTMQTMGGSLAHWSYMVQEKDLDKKLPGISWSISDVVTNYPPSGTCLCSGRPTPEWEVLTSQPATKALERFVNTYWIVPIETLQAYYDQDGAAPNLKTDQTLWYITRVEQNYLFGYCWGMIDGIPIVVQNFTASIQPDGQTEFYFYVRASSPVTGRGTFDFETNRFTMQTMGGGLVHWSYMVQQTDLDKKLPGISWSINDVLSYYPVPNSN